MRARGWSNAFSLTELIVVVAAILILVSLIVVGSNMTYGRAMSLKCQNRLEQIGHACLMYASENQGMYPPVWNFATQSRWYETLATTYLPHPEFIACPLEPVPPITYQSVEFTESDSVMDGLRWLAENQEKDGYWAVEKWGGRTGTRGEGYHTGTTALALMAFLFYGCTDQYPAEYAGTVGSAIDWLISRQDASTGRFRGYDYGTWYLYDHATATMAMALAYIKTGRQDSAASARSGLEHLADKQAPGGSYGWGYDGHKNDISVTGWTIQDGSNSSTSLRDQTETPWGSRTRTPPCSTSWRTSRTRISNGGPERSSTQTWISCAATGTGPATRLRKSARPAPCPALDRPGFNASRRPARPPPRCRPAPARRSGGGRDARHPGAGLRAPAGS